MTYTEKLSEAIQRNKSTLCVGLDPVPGRLPQKIRKSTSDDASAVLTFCSRVIEATKDFCCAYKPNLAFFESLGPKAFQILEEVRKQIPSDKIVIADAKRGDISSSAQHYRNTFFNWLDVDAITVNPLMGFETLEPYLGYSDKAIYVLTLTSNRGANDFFLNSIGSHSNMSVYIADRLNQIASFSQTHIAMVVGATQDSHLRSIIEHHSNGALLIPGLGTQGGRVEDLHGVLKSDSGLPLINSSRSILYAYENDSNWEEAVRSAAKNYYSELKPISNQYV